MTEPVEPRLNLSLNRLESQFLAWCQAYSCAALTANTQLMREAFQHVRVYAETLKAEGINSLGDRHMLLAKSAFPDMQLRELRYNEEPKGVPT